MADEDSCLDCTHISYRKAKWYYSAQFAIAVALMWVTRDYGKNIFDSVSQFNVCKQAAFDTTQAPLDFCYGKEAVLRLAFATFIFFAAHAFILSVVGFFSPGHPQATKLTHAALLPLRLILWIGLVVLCFFTMGSSVFRGFFQFARVAAAIFLIFQVVVLIDFVYMLNGEMVNRQECHAPLVVFTLFLFLAGMAGIVAAYYRFAPNGHCGLNIFFVTMTLILGAAATALSLSPLRPESVGLLTAMMLFAYSVYVLISALFSLPRDLPCTPNPEYGTVRWNLALGFAVSMVAMLIGVIRMGSDSKPFFYQEESLHPQAGPYSATYFHAIFALATCYFVMLFTNWSLAGAPGRFELDVSKVSAWMKIGTQWLCYIAYGWTLAAPKLFPGRDFGHT